MKKYSQGPHSLSEHLMEHKRVLFLHEEVYNGNIRELIVKLEYLNELNHKPITLNICSPGGSVDSGLALYDYIKTSKSPIHTHCSGFAASMGALLLGSGKKGKRTATKNSRIMIHQPSSGYMGKATDIEIHAKETARIRTLLNTIVANDTNQPIKKVAKDMESDLWMTAEEALKYGIIDKIR